MPDASLRYSDSYLSDRAYDADCAVKESCEMAWGTTDISLVDGATYYPLPTDMVAIGDVQYSLDGSTFDGPKVWPATIKDLDSVDPTWKETRASEPTHYALLGCPGATGSKIALYPAVTTAGDKAIRIHYLKCLTSAGLSFAAQTVTDFVEDEVYVPHVLSQLYAATDKKQFVKWWSRFLAGTRKVRAKTRSLYAESLDRDRYGDAPKSWGQI